MAEFGLVTPAPVGNKYGHYSPPYQNGRLLEDSIPYTSVRWRASTVLNKVAYIGNVIAVDRFGKTHKFPDTMLKSEVGSYDTFAPNRQIDVSTDDGEDIVVLESYADRVLQFKTNTLHIINTAQGTEYLEDTRANLGVAHAYAVTQTEYGVAWVNSSGCYLYDGNNITNLLEKRRSRKVKISDSTSSPAQLQVPDWEDVVKNEGMKYKNAVIMYQPKTKKLIVIGNYLDTDEGEGFVFDMALQAWTYHASGLVGDGRISNAVMTHDQEMVYLNEAVHCDTQITYKWSQAPQAVGSGKLQVATKNYDFGDAAKRKTIYKVRVYYKEGANIEVFLSYDGGGTKTSIGTLSSSATRTHADLSANLPAVDIFQCMVIIESNGTTHADMEIYEVDVLFRIKKIKGT